MDRENRRKFGSLALNADYFQFATHCENYRPGLCRTDTKTTRLGRSEGLVELFADKICRHTATLIFNGNSYHLAMKRNG